MNTKFAMLMALLLGATVCTYAQRGGFPRLTTQERVQNVMTKLAPLQLDTTQQRKTSDVFTSFFEAQNKLRQDAMASGQRPDRSKFQELIGNRDAQLKAIFTETQYKKFTQDLEPGLRPGRPGGYGGPRNGNN